MDIGVLVGMGAMAVFRPAGQEAQTAAGVRGRAFLPKTARRAPKALEAGAFWVHRPKSPAPPIKPRRAQKPGPPGALFLKKLPVHLPWRDCRDPSAVLYFGGERNLTRSFFIREQKRAAPVPDGGDSPKCRRRRTGAPAAPGGRTRRRKGHSFSSTEGGAVSGSTRCSRRHGEVPPR